MAADARVVESIREVDSDTWLIGGQLLLHLAKGMSSTSTWYDQNDDFSYTVVDAPVPPPHSDLLRADSSNIKLVYDAGDCSAAWAIGNDVFCKVKKKAADVIPESTTLAFIQERRPEFELPGILHHAEFGGRDYLFLTRVLGRTLSDAWPTLDQKWKHHYVSAIVNACETLASWEADKLGGADGKNVSELYLIRSEEHDRSGGLSEDCDSQKFHQVCERLGMDCSKFVFCHTDLGPGNIIVENDPQAATVGIIDWEVAGYLPKEWI